VSAPETSRTAAASAARSRAADVRRRVTTRSVDVEALLVALDPEFEELRTAAAKVRVERLLRFVPGIGDAAVRVICLRSGVPETARLGALSPARRAALAEHLLTFDVRAYSGNGPARRVA
jgi:hypothetical protein